jgi:hypothetical protein
MKRVVLSLFAMAIAAAIVALPPVATPAHATGTVSQPDPAGGYNPCLCACVKLPGNKKFCLCICENG